MAEQAREFEQDYFRRRNSQSMAQRLSEQDSPITEEISLPAKQTNTKPNKEVKPREYSPNNPKNEVANPLQPQIYPRKFSKGEKSFLVIIGICMLCLTIWNLVVQYRDERITIVTQEYQLKTSEIQHQTDMLLNELALKYDYQTIKQIAHENGMTLQNSQVRNVGQ